MERVRAAHAGRRALAPVGGGTKAFYGRAVRAEPLPLAALSGVLSYEPTELVLTARAGTPLAELEALLAAEGQMLAFEPPAFGRAATLGGTLAAGLSGPRRPYAGAGRDFLLGARVLTGDGQVLRFGGQVMKNVAGFDVSRLMVGAFGTLGVLLEVSLKVLPRPREEITLCQPLDAAAALEAFDTRSGQPLPLSASCHSGGMLYWRLSGDAPAVEQASRTLGGQSLAGGESFWEALKEQRLAFFDDPRPLWRLALPAGRPPLDSLSGEWLYEWGGTLRWLKSDEPAGPVREAARAAGGHATLFRPPAPAEEVFSPLPPALARLHARLKQAFDPAGILNPGRMYPEL